MRVTRYVHRLPVSTPAPYPAAANVYLVEDQGQALLIDAGYDDPQAAKSILDYIETIGIRQVTGIALTHHHPDHCSGAKRLAAFLRCPILCHPLEIRPVEEKIAPCKINSPLQEGDRIPVGGIAVQVLHAPGHTRGHLNFWLTEERLLVAGDNIVGEGTTWIGPPDGHLADYLATLRRLRGLQPSVIAPGHGEMIRDPNGKIEFFIKRRLQREQQILGLLRQKPLTVRELVNAIYQNQVHPGVIWAAERTVLGHLEKLAEEKKIAQEGDRYRIV